MSVLAAREVALFPLKTVLFRDGGLRRLQTVRAFLFLAGSGFAGSP